MIKKNQTVIVADPKIDDLWNHSFIGTVVEINNNTILVKDQDGDCFEVDKNQVEEA